MANNIYLKVHGKNQGSISSGCSTYDSIGNKYQTNHRDEILVISLSFDISRSQNLSHHPISITKYIDKSTPLLMVAITNNEMIDCSISYFRTSSEGSQEKYMEIKLTNASIINYSQVNAHSITENEVLPSEIILLSYESITCNHLIAGTSGYSIASNV
ncbi:MULTISPECIES: Hcp family type VI secretion system effector [Morganella]|uniref:Hcp family type VI secretion system effector n=1 Tax=Morganella TaxID=581 RepID=UPI00244A298F|nr:Hcp family type VI secretion system effector [Morganella sp. GD04133]MDH0353872.1 Hcp family type VI secretion system effector [Morganella sp. GD04133]